MEYIVLKDFTDVRDGGYVYREGDTYPRSGATPIKERIAELCSESNRRKEQLIKVHVEEKPAGRAAKK